VANSSKEDLLPQARALYSAGADKDVIAEAIGVSRRTVRRWAKQDADEGRPWRRGQAPLQEGPAPGRRARLRGRLEARLERLIEEGEIDPDGTRLEDRMLKICRVLDHLQEEDDLSAWLRAMERFAAFCTRTRSEAELEPIRRAVSEWMSHLKEEYS
jgi:transposase